jgi:hypothetical protein
MGCSASKQKQSLRVNQPHPRLESVSAKMTATPGTGMHRYSDSGKGKWTAVECTTHPDTKDPNVQRVMKICGF